jgi:hypothetical protein
LRAVERLAIAALAAVAFVALATATVEHGRPNPGLSALQRGFDGDAWGDPDLEADEAAAGELWARANPGRRCPDYSRPFLDGCRDGR